VKIYFATYKLRAGDGNSNLRIWEPNGRQIITTFVLPESSIELICLNCFVLNLKHNTKRSFGNKWLMQMKMIVIPLSEEGVCPHISFKYYGLNQVTMDELFLHLSRLRQRNVRLQNRLFLGLLVSL